MLSEIIILCRIFILLFLKILYDYDCKKLNNEPQLKLCCLVAAVYCSYRTVSAAAVRDKVTKSQPSVLFTRPDINLGSRAYKIYYTILYVYTYQLKIKTVKLLLKKQLLVHTVDC